MTNVPQLRFRQSLSPEDLATVVDAFEAGLNAVNDADADLQPHAFRQELAKHVLGKAFSGEADARRLKAEAIRFARDGHAGGPT